MTKAIVFDMDGTIADLYSVDGWEAMLNNNNATPYAMAKPLGDTEAINNTIAALAMFGWSVEVISWMAKGEVPKEFAKAIRTNKTQWLKKHFPAIEENGTTHIVKYGTNKWRVSKSKGGILFDDELRNVEQWNKNTNSGQAIHVTNDSMVLDVLHKLLEKEIANADCAD